MSAMLPTSLKFLLIAALLAACTLATDEACGAGLTPKPGPQPQINGPKIYGCRAEKPFLYRIPCFGQRPMVFAAAGLPDGLRLDSAAGIISGTSPARPGEYPVTLTAKNKHGISQRPLKIVVGDTLALTPPMGWNSWYTHFNGVSDAVMREAADVMVSSGMADAGYQYVNIDDCWMKREGDEPYRTAAGQLLPNERFPDMKGMVDYIHAKGLKAGTYTSPGPWTCGRYVGAWQHEEADARLIADWGFDFLKYDWCSYGTIVGRKPTLDQMKEPYAKMGRILAGLDRDIVLNLCQYGMGDVWMWGKEIGGQCWRTGGDLGFTLGKGGVYQIAAKNLKIGQYAGPGAWNDPDYLLIGLIGDHQEYVRRRRATPNVDVGRPPTVRTPLSADEQYSYMSLWCLMAAPLVYSGDMAKLDELTLDVLTNTEVIDLNQDALGKQAEAVVMTDDAWTLVKPLEDGSIGVGLFNLGASPRSVAASWKQLGVSGAARVRDLWRQKDLTVEKQGLSAEVPARGVFLARLWPQ